MEQPIRFIDQELRDVRDLTTKLVTKSKFPLNEASKIMQHRFERYWVKVTDDQGQTLLKTEMTEHAEIPLRRNETSYFVKKDILPEHFWITEEDKDELGDISGKMITFRVLQDHLEINNSNYDLLIAKPIPILAHESSELILEILCWVLACITLTVVLSYYLAGKILRPLTCINELIREISEVSLHKRIPVGKNHDELYTLSSSLNNMFERLQFSFDRQKEYIGNASHELKSPLTVLMLGHEKLLSEPLAETTRTGLEKQLDTLRRLSKLVRNLLEISRLEQHESFDKTQLNLEELVHHVVEEFEDILIEKNIALHSDIKPAYIIGDSDKIFQLLINLLDNAVKYNFAWHRYNMD